MTMAAGLSAEYMGEVGGGIDCDQQRTAAFIGQINRRYTRKDCFADPAFARKEIIFMPVGHV